MFITRTSFTLVIYVLQIAPASAITPKFTWPLAADYAASEVKDGDVDGTVGSDVVRCTSYDQLDYDGIFLRGSPNSYIDLTVTKSERYIRLSFAMFVVATPPYEGVILHYKQPFVYGTIDEIMLWMNGSHLLLDTLDVVNVTYPTLAVPNPFATGNEMFVPFCLSYDDHGEVLFATRDVDFLFTILAPWENRKFSAPSTIRLGGALPEANLTNPVMFRGRITCLHMFSDFFDNADFDTAVTDCLSNKWSHAPVNPSSPQPAACGTSDGALYRLTNDGAVPVSSVPHLETTTASSRLQCAQKCSRLSQCLSFGFVQTSRQCRLFDSNIGVDQFEHVAESKYFTRRSNCC